MKEFFRNIGTGFIFLVLSVCTMLLATPVYYGIRAIPTCSGWEAIGLAIVCILMTGMVVFVIHCMGVIPNSTIDRLERKIAELEDTEDDL